LSVSGELEIWSRGSCTLPSPGSSKTTRGEACVMLATYHQVPFSLLSDTVLHWYNLIPFFNWQHDQGVL
jgi:hypothetical protein